MQAYSMDLHGPVDSDAGMKDVAVKYRVSGSWVRLLKRSAGDGRSRAAVQRHGRRRMLEPHLHTLAALIANRSQ